MKRIIFIWILFLNIALVTGESRGVIFGTLMGMPDEGKVTYVVTSDDFDHILTEDGFNSAKGINQGYQGGYWVLEASNLEPAPQIEVTTITIEFAGIGTEKGKFGRDELTFSNPNENRVEISFTAADNPNTPPRPVPKVLPAGEVQLTWVNAPGVTYDVYRSTQVSGANNEASNGRYQRIAVSVTSPYTDTSAPVDSRNLVWYLLIAKAGGKRSGHSPDVNVNHTPCDVNNDGTVDIIDLAILGSHFGQTGENITGDVSGDGVVDIVDLMLVGSHFGE